MGQVYSAYDPRLDRRVALKLLLTRGSSNDRERLTREAKALARLSHPNVVTVHEVAEYDGRVVIAMEFVDGGTLKGWLTAHPPPHGLPRVLEVLGLLIQAGRGLEAAHDAGLVHRDFKPANVLVGKNARVRVADFGIAQTQSAEAEACITDAQHQLPESGLTRTGAVIGTPFYMAPEQSRGSLVDQRSDQYSFCVTAWELLYGGRLDTNTLDNHNDHIPASVRRALKQGMSAKPEFRHNYMGVLLRKLEAGRDELRKRTEPRSRPHVKWFAGVTLALAGTFAAVRHSENLLAATCKQEGDAIDSVWNPGSRESSRAGLVATGIEGAVEESDRFLPWVDRFAESWRETSASACRNTTIHKMWDTARYDRARWCLDDARLQLTTLLNELANADAQTARGAVLGAVNLPPVRACIDTRVEPPGVDIQAQLSDVRADLSRARHLFSIGEYTKGYEVAGFANTRAQVLNWPRFTAATRAMEAKFLGRLGKPDDAERVGREAFMLAANSGAWDVASSTATQLTYVVGYSQARFDEAELWAELAKVAIGHAGDPLGLREAGRANSLGAVRRSRGEFTEAMELYEDARVTWENALGEHHPFVAIGWHNVANAHASIREYEAAAASNEQALAILEKTLGPEHPLVAETLNNVGLGLLRTGDDRGALHMFERALGIQERAFGPEHPGIGVLLTNIGQAQESLGEYDLARGTIERALAMTKLTLGPAHQDVAKDLSNLGAIHWRLDAPEKAKPLFEQALVVAETSLGVKHPDVAVYLYNLGGLLHELGDDATAQPQLERAVALWTVALGPDHPQLAAPLMLLAEIETANTHFPAAIEFLERAVANRSADGPSSQSLGASRFALARALWLAPTSGHREKKRAAHLVRQARQDYTAAGPDAPLAELDAWVAEHPGIYEVTADEH